MGLREWWAERKLRNEQVRRSLAINDDEDAIAAMVPELAGMGFVAGGAYLMREMDKFNATCTPEQSAELAGRLIASQQAWADEGLTMPYWGNLVVLRKLQEEIRQGQL